jgi:uncharacterized membrane protein YbjE (DUF340 family)
MFTVVLVMAFGVLVGFAIRNRKKIVKAADKLTMWAIYLLLFLLGLAIGGNEIIVRNLPLLGVKALIISIGGITGSVILAWAVYHLWYKPKTKKP